MVGPSSAWATGPTSVATNVPERIHRDRPTGRTMTTDSLRARDTAHLIHPLHSTHTQATARVWVKGEGAVLTDSDGAEYIDGVAGLWNVIAGHGRRELAEAARA